MCKEKLNYPGDLSGFYLKCNYKTLSHKLFNLENISETILYWVKLVG